MKEKGTLMGLTIFLSFVILLFSNVGIASAKEDGKIIPKGVFIDQVDVSGLTKEEAESAIDSFVQELKNKNLKIIVGNDEVSTTLDELGYKYEENDFVDQALNLGKSGNLIVRYKNLKDIEHEGVRYDLTFSLDETKLNSFVSNDVSEYNIAPQNATLSRTGGKFIYTDHKVGRKVEIDSTVQLIKDTILNNWNREDISINAVVVDDMPLYTIEDVKKVDDILGTFTTDYTSSAEGRAENLANGARLINNTVLYPGDTFSAYQYMAPFTASNGYYTAGAYLNGKVIDSVGGGACQVTTTLYNAVLYSELEVVERAAHSMTISYTDLSRDAAIAGTYKDLKFRNNTNSPILIEAFTKGRKITFNIWGNETRSSNRRIEYVTVVLSETPPPADVVTEDPTKPVTYRKVTQSPHTGYKTELYKVVYENGKEVSRTLVNKSVYNPAPRYVTIGTKPVEDKANDSSTKNGKSKKDNSQETANIDEPLDTAPSIDLYWEDAWDDEGFEDE